MSAEPMRSWEEAVRWMISQPDKQDLVRDCYFDSPLESAAERYWKSAEWQVVRTLLPAGKGRALDIGAGRGIASFALACEGWSVVALEPDSSNEVGAGAIRSLAASTNLPIEVIEGIGERIPLATMSVDLVVARQALHHARDLDQVCREVSRVLKPGGTFLAIREHVISRKQDLDAFLALHPLHSLYGGENALLLEEYKSAIIGAGLVLIRTIQPLESEINFPQTDPSSLRTELARRVSELPMLGFLADALLRSDRLYRATLRFLTHVDNRPGRLYSFLSRRP